MMGRHKKQWLGFCNRLMVGILALLGFAGCDQTGPDEYGTPLAEYRVKGKVVDADTKQPVTGMQVVSGVPLDGDKLQWYEADTVYSDVKGEFEIVHRSYPTRTYRVIWEDMRETPEYKKDSTDLAITGKFSGGSGWYEGHVSLEIQIEAQKNFQ